MVGGLCHSSGSVKTRGAVPHDVFEGLQSVICDPQYEALLIAGLTNWEYDWLCLQDVSHFGSMLSALMDMAAHDLYPAHHSSSERDMNC